MSEEAEEDWRYWKAAISRLPTQEMRDAAWEFFVRHFSQNPRLADTLSGLILVMQANGLYMLDAPKIIHEQAIDPLNGALARFREELDRSVSRHKQVAAEACQTAETTVTAVKGLDETIRHGWREVNTDKLSWPGEFIPNWKEPFFNHSQSNAGIWRRPRPTCRKRFNAWRIRPGNCGPFILRASLP